ncbi:uncharacterized protein ACNFOS_007629 [Eudromia elegans]
MELRKSEELLPGRTVPLILLLCMSMGVSAETVRYSVPEEAERGFFVGNILTDLGLTGEELSARQARLVSEGDERYLQLNQRTGDLSVREKMDREALCGQSEPCLVRFEVLLERPLQSFRAEVSVADINDHAPLFLNKEIILKIPESALPGARFLLESAQDADVGNNSLQHYNISSNDYFRISTRRRSDGRRYPELVLERALDREERAEVTFSITAVDGGSPPRSGAALIRVQVLDINDNIPVFTRSMYKVRMPENSAEETLVVAVSAGDLDAGVNGEIEYSIIQNSEENHQTFKINPQTGEIRLKMPVDYEETKTYEIDVQATDGGGLSAHCKVLVEVLDVNDNVPEVVLTSLSSPLSEAAPPQTVVALFSVRDRDSGENGRTSCELLGEQPFSLVALGTDSYALVTADALDREREAEYNVTVRARDAGTPALSAEQPLLVRLSDVNDNAPVFAQASYTLVLRENEPAGTSVGRVSATDADTGENARVSYALVPPAPGAPSFVSVDAESGTVRMLRPLDYEEVRAFQVAVRAADGGSPPLSTQAVLRVEVRDENDNAPVVLHPLPNSSATAGELVPRHAPAGYLVAKVVAVDADSGQNAWLSYEVAKATEPSLFRVALHSGEVRTARAVSERDAARQRLVVLVRDSGQPPRSCSATLSLALVEGFSDAFLKHSQASAGKSEMEEEENVLATYLVASLCSISSLFLLSIVAFLSAKLCKDRLWVGTSSASVPSYADGNFPSSFLDVADAGTLSRAYRYEVCLTTGSEKSAFKFLRPVLPNPPLPQSCDEPEAAPGARAAASASSRFPGAPRRPPATRSEPAAPAMAPARQVLCLWVFLSAPLARCRLIRYSVAEESERGSVVAHVAQDVGLEVAQLGAREARLLAEESRQFFGLERSSGRLAVRDRIDREELCGRALTCTVSFELLLANPLQFFRIEVAIEDINDHSPVFPEEQVTFQIPETSDPGSRFPLEGARDLDVGTNGLQSYSIAPENDYFSVSFRDPSEGENSVELVLEKALDREEEPEFTFSLIASDGGSPPRSGTTQIRIVVLDINDNAPVFSHKLYRGQVLENAPKGSPVVRVFATDADVGANGEVSYSWSHAVDQSPSAFELDARSGDIRVTQPLDFEAAQKHELSVRATDGGGLSALCKVLVEVVDVNDNAPELVVSSFVSPVAESAAAGTVVGLFVVKDRDAGANGQVSCWLEGQPSFSLRAAYKNYYELVTASGLDREETARYVLTVRAADAGSPPLSSTHTFTVDISDVNDNAPVFEQSSYTMFVRENNEAAALVGAVRAVDEDEGSNSRVSYSVAPGGPAERGPRSYVSVHSENGQVFVLRSLDYEEVRELEVVVSAADSGSPARSANVTVRIVVLDENDNAPVVLHPAQDGPAPSRELVPTWAEAGYLVSKVVAVDADSGQNSWLSYELLKATEPGLFTVAPHSGEVRLKRPPSDRDAVKQKLVVLVRDNGRPPLSATAVLAALLLDGFSDAHMPRSHLAADGDHDGSDSLTLYLIVSLVLVSLLFLASAAAFVACKACERKALHEGSVLCGPGDLQSSVAEAAAAGTLPRAYCYEVSLSTGSGSSEFKFLRPLLAGPPPQRCGTGGGAAGHEDFPDGLGPAEEPRARSPGTLRAADLDSLAFH